MRAVKPPWKAETVPCEFKLVRQVEFPDTDKSGFVHFSAFLRYMEAAEHAFFRSLGYSIWTRGLDPPVGWPRVQAGCDLKHPLRFEDQVEIHLLVREKKDKSIAYEFIFRKLNEQPVKEVGRGTLLVVCVTRDKGKMKSASIPPLIAERIEVAPPELLEPCP